MSKHRSSAADPSILSKSTLTRRTALKGVGAIGIGAAAIGPLASGAYAAQEKPKVRLGTWAAWVIPVGRLSFPTGPAVTRLMSRPDQRGNQQAGDAS